MSKSSRSRAKSRKNRAAKARRVALPKTPRVVAKPIDVALSFDVKLDMAPVGFATEDCAPGGTSVKVLSRGFLTPDDGQILYTYLDQIGGMYLTEQLAKRGLGSYIVHNFLVNVTDGVNARVYVNFRTHKSVMPKRSVKGGQVVYGDDIAHLREVGFPQFPMPTEGAIVYSFREGWRQALYFDYSMMPDEPNRPLRELPKLFAQYHNWMAFRELFLLKPDELERLYSEGWFPFVRTSMQDILDISRAIKAGYPLEAPIKKLVDSVPPGELRSMQAHWQGKSFYKDQAEFIDTALRHYQNADYMSAISVLAPRIEGIMRTLHIGSGTKPRAPQLRDKLVEHVRKSVDGPTRFMPEPFRDYLETFFFANFDVEKNDVPMSRNSFAHGVISADQFSQARALQLLLILDQIAFYW